MGLLRDMINSNILIQQRGGLAIVGLHLLESNCLFIGNGFSRIDVDIDEFTLLFKVFKDAWTLL